MDCYAYCTASSYKISSIHDALRSRYSTSVYDDVLHVATSEDSDVFCFAYGAVVFWGLSLEDIHSFLLEIKDYEQGHLVEPEIDEFSFAYGEKTTVSDDTITFPKGDVLTKLAFSHGIAQSVKLGAFEEKITKTYNQTKQIPEGLARWGKISLSRREIRRQMGALFLERSFVTLHLDVLDIPEFFWENPDLEPYYLMIAKELDLEDRAEVLNRRLDEIRELFQMLANELNNQHSNRLEWTIIWLIIIEVAFTLTHDILGII